jgi:predicted nucleotidyltransferase
VQARAEPNPCVRLSPLLQPHPVDRDVRFALVGGLAVSIRGEVRFTRDVDVAVAVEADEAVESLVRGLRSSGYTPIAVVEHETMRRLATARLESPHGVVVDLRAASSGIESEVVARATLVAIEGVGDVPVARAEELLAMKVLSMTARRLQDRLDALSLLLTNPALDIEAVRALLQEITRRGYHRAQDLVAKLDAVLTEVRDAGS